MSDRVGVLSDKGVLEQIDTPVNLYNHPKTAFVASFVGETNQIDVTAGPGKNGNCKIDTSFGTLTGTNPLNLAPGTAAAAFSGRKPSPWLTGHPLRKIPFPAG